MGEVAYEARLLLGRSQHPGLLDQLAALLWALLEPLAVPLAAPAPRREDREDREEPREDEDEDSPAPAPSPLRTDKCPLWTVRGLSLSSGPSVSLT